MINFLELLHLVQESFVNVEIVLKALTSHQLGSPPGRLTGRVWEGAVGRTNSHLFPAVQAVPGEYHSCVVDAPLFEKRLPTRPPV